MADDQPVSSANETNISITEELRNSFRDYSMSVIIGRALPDVRDGLKPVHRRILYAMYKEGLLSSKKFSKCAGVVGEVLKKYHPHGDMPVYDALVRMAQPWNLREVLIDGQGNFGSVDGDPAAAYRYTEARLSKIAEELLADIKEGTVDFVPNFDGTVEEPWVLPSRVPNLLVNGSEGIAVAMATRCPPHNLGEVVTALLAVIDEKYFEGEAVTAARLGEIIPGPDFPTGGIICGRSECQRALETGRGSIMVRGRVRTETMASGREQILIDEIPYQVNKARLLERIAALVREKRIDGISDLRDESDRDGMQIAIDLKRDAIADVVINQLYQHTPLQSSYPVNLLAIVNGQPKSLNIQQILNEFLSFRQEVVTRRTRFRLDQAQKRFHLLAGILTALDDIDRVITIIRSSKNADEAKARLCSEQFANAVKLSLFASSPTEQVGKWLEQGYANLDETQAAAIMEMRLSRLVALERDKLVEEGIGLLASIDGLKEILGDIRVLMQLVRDELVELTDKYATPRRTQIAAAMDTLTIEDLIAEEDMLVTVSRLGYVKRGPLTQYQAQARGGKGKKAASARDEDFIQDAFVASTHAYLMTFTSFGKVYWVKVHQLPNAGPQARGRPIVNLINLAEGEKVCAILPVRHFPETTGESYVITCSKKGKVKKTDLKAYANPRASGLIACGIEKGDEIIEVKLTHGEDDILISTESGMAIRFSEADVRPSGRQAMGVRGIALRANDNVVGMDVVSENATILTVTEFGYGKRTHMEEYRRQARAGMGIITIKVDARNGRVVKAVQVEPTEEIMIITDSGKSIRMKVSNISLIGRNTKGVRLITLGSKVKERVMSVARIVEGEEEESEALAPDQEEE